MIKKVQIAQRNNTCALKYAYSMMVPGNLVILLHVAQPALILRGILLRQGGDTPIASVLGSATAVKMTVNGQGKG